MKLIIDIPKEKYDWIMSHLTLDRNFRECKITPFPKGHGRLVDADKMIKELNERIQIFDEGRNEIRKQLGRPEENNQIPLWLWKGCCETCGIIIEADKGE